MRRWLAPIALLGLVVACSDEVVVLASVPKGDDRIVVVDLRCYASEQCPAGFYCERTRCDPGAFTAGSCAPYPACADIDEEPVCGCDGVTYFNDCLRRLAGVAGAEPYACPVGTRACQHDGECPEGATCTHLVGSTKKSLCEAIPGSCWVLPPTCPSGAENARWDECSEVPGAPRCISTCEAVRSGAPHVRAKECP